MGIETQLVGQNRRRFAALWVAHAARALADTCFVALVASTIIEQAHQGVGAAWYLLALSLALPFILFAPVYGALASGRPAREILVVASGSCACVAILPSIMLHGPHVGWFFFCTYGLHALASAASSPARYAVLSAVATDASLPLNRMMGWMQMGTALGAAGGLVLGRGLLLAEPGRHGLPGMIGQVLLYNLIATDAAYLARFASDRGHSGGIVFWLRSFFADSRRILADAETRRELVGLSIWIGIVVAGAAAFLVSSLADARADWPETLAFMALGLAIGSLLASIQRHPYRVLGLVPLAALGLAVALIWAALAFEVRWPSSLFGAMGGLGIVPLRTAYQVAVPQERRGNGLALLYAAIGLGSAAGASAFLVVSSLIILSATGAMWILAALTSVGLVVLSRILTRELIEQVSEIVLAPIYRVHEHGPGVTQIPMRGPLLIVANHAAWFDPLWLGKIVPRPVYPMMTSRFYDLPGIRWLMEQVVHAIRVPETNFRREAPELKEAIAVLDRGECLVIFPEGAMKRKDEQMLRQFGQGVWRILQERPSTPVIACWIEGGWGCYLSYWNGPPTKNKRFDFWRRIDIGVGPLQMLTPEVLEDQRATRGFLMHACLDARHYLALPPLSPQPAEMSEPV